MFEKLKIAFQKEIGLTLRPISADLEEDDYRLRLSNTYYYQVTRGSLPSPEQCKKERYILPEDADPGQQIYCGLYDESRCRAILELQPGYPDEKTVYLAWIILDSEFQGQGLGSSIMQVVYEVSKQQGFEKIRLACYEANRKGIAFWEKQGFSLVKFTEKETDTGVKKMLVLERSTDENRK